MTTAWMDFCENKDKPKSLIRAFLYEYVLRSRQKRPAIGKSETQVVQTISAAKSALTFWRNIVYMADTTILNEARHNDPNNRHKWKLRWADVGAGGNPGSGPVADVSRVSLFIFLFSIKY